MIKAVTGTKDILPSDIPKWKHLESVVQTIFKNFNYSEIRTPIFEETVLFARGIGEETDIVGKEMYTFLDKGQTSITLKPEMTASVVRAFIEHSLASKQPLYKLYYISPMFRQERPQAGRLRQFHQFGVEAIGSESPILDAEIIQIAYDILRRLGLKDLLVKINSLGIPESRENYKKELRHFLNDKKNKLSEDSQKRFDTNILRVFDSKIETDQELLKGAPILLDYLDEESKIYFNIVRNILREADIPFEIDTKLVRGLDYYAKTTFEIISGKVGSQNALCGGGRYDLLAEQLEGKPTPGVGFAAGIERILLACENEKTLSLPEEKLDFYIVTVGENLIEKVYNAASILRRRNFSVEFDYLDRSAKAQMREANKLNARFVIFFGGDEYSNGYFSLKNMQTGEQKQFPLEDLKTIVIE
ncbi:MAG: histidine--tRNA ligase [Ignavibacteria bacterium RIFOXYB2_FULL_35_12]|nr:MAG: histidine--tRNA ligase [Ignavibacteria bacterium GWA2_36_19]OGU53737.1 MAG: histidine--tRNA ligase [Ignavibacteria bacterium GWC2_35_8]OGU59887.1 MAG: histidine--tRNA ligase [Ignavibacteria bacterium GWF2_35_20]OGU82182.1 MAG: histidine--tRNA ligase [Ignavibacteria bacterium RIFOXYA2_FULL_35_9]OGU89294.1 MAG: histidine--tRNA ligase [Ignavibacteria bacterium RIFOXYC12_FULL_35_11]OGU90710.1 MAG: histidine--tRNA ligase [Ignavibacteria bacterium RIFOXYA12_FULL_35_25]OGU97272.1 MAG: histid